MPTYISLINWTDQGVRNSKQTVERGKAGTELAQRMGGNAPGTYWTVGPCDIVSIAEFPDDESGTAFLLALERRATSAPPRSGRTPPMR